MKQDDAINTTSNLSPAICDIPVGYDADLRAIEQVILSNLGKIKKRIPKIKEGPYYYGVQTLDSSGVVIRVYSKANEQDKHQVRRDLNREVKLLFDDFGIIVPFNQLVVHDGNRVSEKESVLSPQINDKGKLVIPVKSRKYKVYKRATSQLIAANYYKTNKDKDD